MSYFVNKDLKKDFSFASRRDKLAADYFTSTKFFHQLDDKIHRHLVIGTDTECSAQGYVEIPYPDIDALPRDMPHLQKTFDKLKEKYPELNHLRIEKGGVIVDTKPNTWMRRKWSAPGRRGVYGA